MQNKRIKKSKDDLIESFCYGEFWKNKENNFQILLRCCVCEKIKLREKGRSIECDEEHDAYRGCEEWMRQSLFHGDSLLRINN